MSERSDAEIVWVFLVFPPLMSLGFMIGIGCALWQYGITTAEDLFGIIWCVVVLPLIAMALPIVG